MTPPSNSSESENRFHEMTQGSDLPIPIITAAMAIRPTFTVADAAKFGVGRASYELDVIQVEAGYDGRLTMTCQVEGCDWTTGVESSWRDDLASLVDAGEDHLSTVHDEGYEPDDPGMFYVTRLHT